LFPLSSSKKFFFVVFTGNINIGYPVESADQAAQADSPMGSLTSCKYCQLCYFSNLNVTSTNSKNDAARALPKTGNFNRSHALLFLFIVLGARWMQQVTKKEPMSHSRSLVPCPASFASS
jgi:DNA-binding MurR/RpiR family transcriptional regulator